VKSDTREKGESDRQGAPITIKKYANRRLYNTATSSYVTLDHLCQMVQDGVDFVVYDAKTGDDITRSVLTQIIVEEEAKGQNLLPINFLRQLISFYGHSMQWMVPSYLEQMMDALAQNQDRLRQSMQEAFGGMFPFSSLEAMGKQNMAAFEQAMRLFTPFSAEDRETTEAPPAQDKSETATAGDESLEQLKAQVDMLQRQLESMSKTKKGE
jgi:polyhydroxyalkanoate synthesis repressor PhaR